MRFFFLSCILLSLTSPSFSCYFSYGDNGETLRYICKDQTRAVKNLGDQVLLDGLPMTDSERRAYDQFLLQKRELFHDLNSQTDTFNCR